jgi:hypothetical protein
MPLSLAAAEPAAPAASAATRNIRLRFPMTVNPSPVILFTKFGTTRLRIAKALEVPRGSR